MDKKLDIRVIKGQDQVVEGNNKKFLPRKNTFIDKVYDAGSKTIVATDDAKTISGTTGGTNVINVLTNDTVGGVAATLSNVELTLVSKHAKLSMASSGAISVENPTTAGTYTLTYKICQIDRKKNCDTAVVTITVS